MTKTNNPAPSPANLSLLKLLTYLMFFIFAMTTDAVGVIIPEIIEQYQLSLTQASTFHYATMIAIALSGMLLGFLADRIGRKLTILLGLGLFGFASLLFMVNSGFSYFLLLLIISGVAIGVFKTGALALIGDITQGTKTHTGVMNNAEGWFGVGAIVGPAIATYLISQGVSWTYLYGIAAGFALLLCLIASSVQYPVTPKPAANTHQKISFVQSFAYLKDPYALSFSSGIALYVVIEAGVYVWLPTLLKSYEGNFVILATYAISIFFVLRAAGRFLGAWLLSQFDWKFVLCLCAGVILLCFALSSLFGVAAAIWLMPLSGLFMSVVYPTLNAQGINCFPVSQHGSIAGILLFFTGAAAALGPLIMGIVGDAFGDLKFGFLFSTFCAALLFCGLLWNLVKNPLALRTNRLQQDNPLPVSS